MRRPDRRIEWPTLALIIATSLAWAFATTWLASLSTWGAIIASALIVALYSSLQHEAIHGHPTRHAGLNEALVFPALALVIPYRRFRDLHLAHHTDATLTDPFDDPESNYLDGGAWNELGPLLKVVMRANNTLFGRMVLGPLIGQIMFMRSDWHLIRRGDRAVLLGWLWHLVALVPVVIWLGTVATMPLWAYFAAVYGALAILKIRTYLEHQAHEKARGRTVVIEDRGLLAFLFLNNNFHTVHHMHPRVPWYLLPKLYFDNRARYLSCNDGYVFRSYGDVFRRFFVRAKDPVVHPLWHREG